MTVAPARRARPRGLVRSSSGSASASGVLVGRRPHGRRLVLRGRLRGRAGGGPRRPRPGCGRRRERPRRGPWRRPPALAWAFAPSLIETSVLPCGIRLVTETMADVRSVAVAYWVGTGSRDEPGELAGASHFLEHLLFKGTERRSAAAIAEQLDEVGGDCNAFTTKEYTTFYVRLLSEHLPLGLDILSDIMWAAGAAPRRHRGRAHGHPRRDPDARRRAGRPGGGAVAGGALPRARPRAGHPGDGVVGAAHHPRRHPRLLRSALPAVQHGRLGRRRLHPRGGGGRPGAALRRHLGWRRPGPHRAGARHGRARRGPPVHRAGAPDLRHALGLALRRAALGAGRAEPRPGGRPVEPALPEGARAARAGLLGVVGAVGLPGQRIAGRGRGHGARACRRGAAHRRRGVRAAGRRRGHRAGAGGGQGKPARRDAPLGRGLGCPHEPPRRVHAAARRGALGRRGAGPHRRDRAGRRPGGGRGVGARRPAR